MEQAATPVFAAKINFQPASAAVPGGYLVDSGAVFGSRGNGYSYGWNADNSAQTRDRNAGTSPDQRYDTLTHLQLNGTHSWELAVPNGSYTVRMVAGDPSWIDNVDKIAAEGVLVVSGTPTGSNPWVEGTATVTVNDGRLSVAPASGASNAKLNFIEVTSLATDGTGGSSSGGTGGTGSVGSGSAAGTGSVGSGSSGSGGSGSAGAVTYSTNFDLNESPISESGRWRHAGLDWTFVETSGGFARGTQAIGVTRSGAGRYNDSYAYLTGFPANQQASAVAHLGQIDASCTHEFELLVRWSDADHSARGYECNVAWDGSYVQVVRWNGPVGDFTYIGNTGNVPGGIKEGDTISASVVGNTITIAVNGVTRATAQDSAFTSGGPGMGFWRGTSGCGTPGDVAFTSFNAKSL